MSLLRGLATRNSRRVKSVVCSQCNLDTDLLLVRAKNNRFVNTRAIHRAHSVYRGLQTCGTSMSRVGQSCGRFQHVSRSLLTHTHRANHRPVALYRWVPHTPMNTCRYIDYCDFLYVVWPSWILVDMFCWIFNSWDFLCTACSDRICYFKHGSTNFADFCVHVNKTGVFWYDWI